MPEGQVVTLDCCYGSATVTRFLRSSVIPLINTNLDLAILITAGQDIVLPGPYVEATGPPITPPEPQFSIFDQAGFETGQFDTTVPPTPVPSPQPFRLVQPIPQVAVTRPDGATFVYDAIIIGDRNFQGRLDYSTPIGIVEAGTMCRAIMPAADLTLAGTYSAYLHFDTTSTAIAYFLVETGVPPVVPPEPGVFDFQYPDFEPRDFQAGPVP